ncbi:MAG TPA: hypothetical protein PKA05_13700 [Roseiflexaceae bacterium]|nr:hypothetical protein [Roseiflexaceae bacterium]
MTPLFRDPKRLFATLFGALAGVLVLMNYTVSIPVIDLIAFVMVQWAALLTAIALLIGLLSVAGNHLQRVRQRRSEWGYSLVLLLSMLLVIISGTVIGFVPGSYVLFPSSLAEQPMRDLFQALYQPLASSFLALLTFFSLSAAIRAFRRRSAEAAVIVVVTAIAVLVAVLPQLQVASIVGDGVAWLYEYLALAGARGLLIGSAIGATVAGVRILLGFDQPYLDR